MANPIAGLKLAGVAGTLGLFALETLSDQPDLIRYAITQGGLLAVVLVLLWSYRRDFAQLSAFRAERMQVLTDLVQQATAAQTKSAETQAAMARSVEEMTRTIAHMSGRA